MASPVKKPQPGEYTAIAVMFILLLLLSPLRKFWAALDAPWYSPYLVWIACIAAAWWLQRNLHKHEL